jgi:uncharacterized integral membrane protein
MLSKTRDIPARSPDPEVIPEPATGPGADGAHAPDAAITPTQTATVNGRETRTGRFRRQAHRTRLYAYAIAGAALLAFLVALAATNTARVKVNWVFGTSHVSLVWLVLFAAILGWLLGLVAAAAFHWRTRAPRRRRGARS